MTSSNLSLPSCKAVTMLWKNHLQRNFVSDRVWPLSKLNKKMLPLESWNQLSYVNIGNVKVKFRRSSKHFEVKSSQKLRQIMFLRLRFFVSTKSLIRVGQSLCWERYDQSRTQHLKYKFICYSPRWSSIENRWSIFRLTRKYDLWD